MRFGSHSQHGSTGVDPRYMQEGPIAKGIESRTARLPSDLFLWAAGGSVLTSLALALSNRKETANFVGQWAPTFLVLGLYNKMVKLLGHD